jgi:hypothetical protein
MVVQQPLLTHSGRPHYASSMLGCGTCSVLALLNGASISPRPRAGGRISSASAGPDLRAIRDGCHTIHLETVTAFLHSLASSQTSRSVGR